MTCVNCSAEIPAGAQSCLQCGTPASASATTGPQMADPPPGGPAPGGPPPAWTPPAAGPPPVGVPPAGPPPAWTPPAAGPPPVGVPPAGPPPAWTPPAGPATQAPPPPPGSDPGTGPAWQPPPAYGNYPAAGLPYQPWPPQPGAPWAPGGTGYVAPWLPAAASARGGLKVTAGILAIVGAVLVVVACAVPFVSFAFGSHHQSSSIFSPGPDTPGSDFWFVVEPVGVALLAIVGGVLLLAKRQGRLPIVAAGMLAAFGIQTLFLFLGYAVGYDNSGNQVGAGGPLGMVAGVMLAVAGFIGVASLRDPVTAQNPAPGPTLPPAGVGAGMPPYPPA